ncbi:MAG: hypothetical protein ABJP86_16280 [Flavobacteriaceae bacterium]
MGIPTIVTDFGVMDDLTYTYIGNQLKAVDDDIAASATPAAARILSCGKELQNYELTKLFTFCFF